MKLGKEQEFKIPDYDEEIENVSALVQTCRIELESNKIQGIPYFNEILDRELDAIIDCLTKINHFHASARSARTALELTAINLYRYNYPGGKLVDASFYEKYGLRSLSHPKKSPLLDLVRNGVLGEEVFIRFCESYRDLSEYVHHRVTYVLSHTLPEKIKSSQDYAEVLRLAVKKGHTAIIVKSTLIKYSLEPALEVLLTLLEITSRYAGLTD